MFVFRPCNSSFSFRCHLMETSAAAAPAGSFFPSFVLLVCGTLVAAVLCVAHRLGLFNRLMHKVRGHRWETSWGAARGGLTSARKGLSGDSFQGPAPIAKQTGPGLCFVRDDGEVRAARMFNTLLP